MPQIQAATKTVVGTYISLEFQLSYFNRVAAKYCCANWRSKCLVMPLSQYVVSTLQLQSIIVPVYHFECHAAQHRNFWCSAYTNNFNFFPWFAKTLASQNVANLLYRILYTRSNKWLRCGVHRHWELANIGTCMIYLMNMRDAQLISNDHIWMWIIVLKHVRIFSV